MPSAAINAKPLNLQRFNPEVSLVKPFTCILNGRRGTGKSTILRDFLFHMNRIGYPRVVVFSATEEGNEFFSSIIPKAYIHPGLDLDKLRMIVDAQRQVVKACREMEARTGQKSPFDTRLVLVLDDIMYKRAATRTEIFAEIFLNGRHWNLSILLTCQYIMLVDTACRANVDFVVCLKEPIPKNRLKLYDSFFGCFPKKQEFFTVLDQCTTNWEALILDNTKPILDVETAVKWYKADINLPPFTFGSKTFHQFAGSTPQDPTTMVPHSNKKKKSKSRASRHPKGRRRAVERMVDVDADFIEA